MQLYNTLSAEKRAELIDNAGKQRLTLSFYAYAKIENPQKFRDELFIAWNPLEVLGRIYVATEGINAQLSVPANEFYDFKETIEAYSYMKGIRLNVAVEHDDHSFLKLTIKVRDKIVADGLNDDTLDVTDIGIHLNAKKFNELIDHPNTILVDMRNHYESEIGHFVGAITPDVETFRESLPIIENEISKHKEDKNLLMYCTGGIRCEKASAYFKNKGFKNVYQLEGGIIEYTRQVKELGLESKFIGKNFVFDHRLGERITDAVISKCHQCGAPCDNHTNCDNLACHLLFIQCESCKEATQNCCSADCQEVINMSLVDQVNLRKGIKKGNMIFRKGKSDKLLFKTNSKNTSQTPFSVKVSDDKIVRSTKKITQKKVLIGTGEHYFVKSEVGLFNITNNEIKIGDKILITGPTTGNQELILDKMKVNGFECEVAKIGEKITLKIPFRIRSSDKLFKILP